MQTFTGTVTSAKTPQTVAVEFSYFHKHPKYRKIIRLTTKLLAHNEFSNVVEGDTVRIVKCRPYSKNKHFKVLEIIGKEAQKAEKPIVKPAEDKVAKPVSKTITKTKTVKGKPRKK